VLAVGDLFILIYNRASGACNVYVNGMEIAVKGDLKAWRVLQLMQLYEHNSEALPVPEKPYETREENTDANE